jgi:hypothetical protein
MRSSTDRKHGDPGVPRQGHRHLTGSARSTPPGTGRVLLHHHRRRDGAGAPAPGMLLTLWLLLGPALSGMAAKSLTYTDFSKQVDVGKVKTAAISANGEVTRHPHQRRPLPLHHPDRGAELEFATEATLAHDDRRMPLGGVPGPVELVGVAPDGDGRQRVGRCLGQRGVRTGSARWKRPAPRSSRHQRPAGPLARSAAAGRHRRKRRLIRPGPGPGRGRCRR